MVLPAKDSCDKLASEEEYTKQERTNTYFGDYIDKQKKYSLARCDPQNIGLFMADWLLQDSPHVI